MLPDNFYAVAGVILFIFIGLPILWSLGVFFLTRITYTMLDRCEICHGKRGGVRGNENIVGGKLMCDYCHSQYLEDENKN